MIGGGRTQTWGGRGGSGAALFAREYAGGFDAAGWELWRLKDSDLDRLGIPPAPPSADAPAQEEEGGAWARYSNDWGALCSTYPTTLVLPKACTTAEPALMTEVGSFRSKGRIPILSWLHPRTGVSISRCAQPRTGFTGTSTLDAVYLQHIAATNPGPNGQAGKLLIAGNTRI